ncbi:thiaminase II [Alteribacillus sp. HJP-4]|uniref:thiaminase II n=1 Tax=Alteribacillus sp. HJP-4 TaxID=2775394 RepID=UPI0035CCF09A
MTTFSQKIREKADPIWQDSFRHPFIRGIAEGTLPIEKFKYYVLQDAYYLSHFARIQAAGASKAEDFYTVSRMAAHSQGSYEAEMGLHEQFADLLNITDTDRKQFRPSPTAYAYTSHLYRAAWNGRLGHIIAALLPCYWLYYEIGERLQGETPGEPVYQKWINTYGGEWFQELVNEQIERLDHLAVKASEEEQEEMEENFLISSNYEYSFWEMAYHREDWSRAKGV